MLPFCFSYFVSNPVYFLARSAKAESDNSGSIRPIIKKEPAGYDITPYR